MMKTKDCYILRDFVDVIWYVYMYTSHRQVVKLLLGDDLLTQGIVLLDLWIGYSELLK